MGPGVGKAQGRRGRPRQRAVMLRNRSTIRYNKPHGPAAATALLTLSFQLFFPFSKMKKRKYSFGPLFDYLTKHLIVKWSELLFDAKRGGWGENSKLLSFLFHFVSSFVFISEKSNAMLAVKKAKECGFSSFSWPLLLLLLPKLLSSSVRNHPCHLLDFS